jgi:hypothetical protein
MSLHLHSKFIQFNSQTGVLHDQDFIRKQIFLAIVYELISIRTGVESESSILVIQERMSFSLYLWSTQANPVLFSLCVIRVALSFKQNLYFNQLDEFGKLNHMIIDKIFNFSAFFSLFV